jgi:hypothetical protein
MKKFTTYPVGLGINHIEQEMTVAYCWNQLADEGKRPDEPFVAPAGRIKHINERNAQTGLSLINTKHVIDEGNGIYRLSDITIIKCNNFLNKTNNSHEN